MSIKIEFEKENPITSLFRNQTFSTNGNTVNTGLTTGIVDTVLFGAATIVGYHNGLPMYNQEMRIQFLSDVPDNQPVVDNFSSFTYHRTELKWIPEIETPIESPTTKHTILTRTYSYYNFQLPQYETATLEADESSLPCYLFAICHKKLNNGYSAGLLERRSAQYTGLSDAKFLGRYPSHTNNDYHKFNFHSDYEYSLNYPLNYSSIGMGSDDFSETSKVIFSTIPRVTKPREDELYHLPFYNFITIPKSSGNSAFLIPARKSIEANSLADITMRYAHLKNEMGEMSSLDGNPSFDMDEFLDAGITAEIERELPYTSTLGISLSEATSIQKPNAPIDQFELFSSLESLKIELEKIVMNKLITLDDIPNKPTCYNDVVFYKVVKTRAGRTTPVQTFYFFNPSANNQKRQFVDTQIRYGTEYTYTFYPYYCVVGFEYEIENSEYIANLGMFKARYRIVPSIKMVEANSGQRTMTIVTPPPRKPIIKFSNFKQKDNKIKITAEDRTGVVIENRFREELVTISENDEAYKQHLNTYCNSAYPYYSNVASHGIFEIYRLEEEPKSISDFAGNLVQVISNDIADQYLRKRIKKTSTIHYLEHGKKYYYLFRALTHQNTYSNPSPVYEVEKIKDSDETILRVKTIKIKEPEVASYDTSFRKFLKLSYPEYHTTVRAFAGNNELNTAIGPNVKMKLGDDGLPDGLWKYNSLSGSHIKLRLESKSTGKKIDFNLIFNYNQPENN